MDFLVELNVVNNIKAVDLKEKNNKNRDRAIREVLTELKFIKSQLAKLLLLIPEESLYDYENPERIKRDLLEALKEFPPG